MNPQKVMKEVCDLLGVMEPEILGTNGFRWTITQPNEDFYKVTLRLEAMLQMMTGRPIDLHFEPMADKNKRAGRNGRE